MSHIIRSLFLAIAETVLAPPLDDPGEAKEHTDSRSFVQPASTPMHPWPTLAAPVDFRFVEIAVDRQVARKFGNELALQWSPVIGARSYAVQFCDARRCTPPSRKPALRGQFGEEESFRDLVIVSGTRYVAAELFPRKPYWFRVIAIDARGQRGDYSAVLSGSVP